MDIKEISVSVITADSAENGKAQSGSKAFVEWGSFQWGFDTWLVTRRRVIDIFN